MGQKTIRIIAAFLLLAVSLLTACKKNPEKKDPGNKDKEVEARIAGFKALDVVGAYDGELSPLFQLSPESHEMVYNERQGTFSIQDAGLSTLFSATLTPDSGEEGCFDVQITSSVEGLTAGSFKMKEVRRENDLLWLWEEGNTIGIIILIFNDMKETENNYASPDLELSLIVPGRVIATSSELDDYDVVIEVW